MSTEKRSLIFKAFINARFNYCPLVWMFQRKQLNNQINCLHKKALRGTYEDRYSSFSEPHLVFYKQVGSGLGLQSCFYLHGFWGSKLLNGLIVVLPINQFVFLKEI